MQYTNTLIEFVKPPVAYFVPVFYDPYVYTYIYSKHAHAYRNSEVSSGAVCAGIL